MLMPLLLSPLPAQRLLDVRRLADQLFAEHGLNDWELTFNRGKRTMGWCLFGPRRIELSIHFVQRNDSEVIRDTLLHEIAHALVGPGHGHDAVWKCKCLEIGARPERLSYEVNMPEGRWQAHCGQCGRLHHRHRKPKWMKGWYCSHCGKERGQLVWYDSARPQVSVLRAAATAQPSAFSAFIRPALPAAPAASPPAPDTVHDG